MFCDSQRSAVHDGERSGVACVKNCGLWVWLTDKLNYAAGKLQSYNSESDSNTDEWECIDYRDIGSDRCKVCPVQNDYENVTEDELLVLV